MKESFTLKEIADWQLFDKDIELPTIQRGFVWKPKQVEDLWDSLLRGYPIGSFLFSRSSNKLYLMDGQQRSTSIFLGYFNPFEKKYSINTWSIKNNIPVLWIDLKPEEKPESNKYLIRVITQSHPWGYQAHDNGKKLSLSDRRAALEIFRKNPDNKNGYTSFKNTTIFPYDCSYPIPMSFFLESNSINEILNKVEVNLPNYLCTKRGNFQTKEQFINILKTDLKDDLAEFFETTTNIKSITIKSNVIQDKVLKEENNQENPTLFVRMNSAGTALTTDDLIYSIYKAVFPNSKKIIENIGLNFIPAKNVLSLVCRMVTSKLSDDKFTKKLNVRDFQRKIKEPNFKKILQELIDSNKLEILFKNSIEILSCKENKLFIGEIPPVIIKTFIKKHSDLFLFLVYWIYIHPQKLNDRIKLKIVAKLFCFAWFGFKKFSNLWNLKIKKQNFWNEPLNNFMWWNGNDGTHFLIPPNLLREYYMQDNVLNRFKNDKDHKWYLIQKKAGLAITEYYKNIKKSELDDFQINSFFGEFIDILRFNRQLVIFAQRDYINSTFVDFNQLDDIDDTSAPWDWDHIYPSEWVYRKQYCNQGIKDWNNTSGNLRAISLESNRSRGNRQAPKDISSKQEQRDSFILDSDWNYWKHINDRIWDDKVQNHFRSITIRMINIYEKFWKDLMISDLIKIEK